MRRGTTLNDLMQWDDTLFDGITLNEKIEHGTLVSAIMFQCGLQPCLYQDYDVFKSQVHWWFDAHAWNFDRLVKLIELDYNPLWNKDGVITHTETREFEGKENEVIDSDLAKTGTIKDDKDATETLSGADTVIDTYNSQVQTVEDTDTSDTRNATATHSVKGFNATEWQETDRDVTNENGTGTKDRTETQSKTGTDNEKTEYGRETKNVEALTETFDTNEAADTNRDRQEQNLTTIKIEDVEQGNIGVTTSQAMFKKELDLLGGFNLYQWIARKFDNDLMMGVYI